MTVRVRIPKPLKLSLIVSAILVAVYVGTFVWRFDLLSAPVRNDTQGWLGPARRGDTHVVDIGKSYFYEGTDYSDYQRFRPLCKVWLFVTGF